MNASPLPTRPEVTFQSGQVIKTRWGQWHRRDTILLDGRPLEGFVQVRRRYWGRGGGHSIEIATHFRGSRVFGTHPDWLIRQISSNSNP